MGVLPAVYHRRTMKCPHCLVTFDDFWAPSFIGDDADGKWTVYDSVCSNCQRRIIGLSPQLVSQAARVRLKPAFRESLTFIRPKGAARPVPTEVPKELAAEFTEACVVLPDSAKASAALSRRCLQHLLREHVKVKKADLSKEIQEVLDSGKLPSHLADSIDGIRNTGNFAAHPNKSTNTGEIIDVEPGEAEWNLDTLEGLFDFYFVQPERTRARRAALQEAGKPGMK
jgi:Domain of unknown function (DUF4145)